MFPRHALRFFDCADFPACVLCIKIIKQISERGKIIVALCAVNAVIDSDIAHISFHEKDFCIVADFQIVTPQTGHILDNDCRHISGFNLRYHAVKIRSVKGHARNAVVNEKYRISKAIVSGIFRQNRFL